MNSDMVMRKTSEAIENEFRDSGESTLIKNKVLLELNNSDWEASVRSEIRKILAKADGNMSAKELFDAVKDGARRDVPTDIKKKLYEQVLNFVQTANNQ